VDSVPVVGVSVDAEFSRLLSKNTLPLSKILAHLLTTCFYSSPKSPNPQDPLFLNLRVKTKCHISNTKPCDVYPQLASVLSQVTSVLYVNDRTSEASSVDGGTYLAKLMGKMVICMDTTYSPEYASYAPSLSKYVNVDTGNSTWTIYKYSDFLTMTPNILTTSSSIPLMAEPQRGVLQLIMAQPDTKRNVNNPESPLSWIRNFGCQTIFCQFYQKDGGLETYEKLFDYYGTAFVPIGFAVNYTK
jgi:hypothetical protein